MANDEWATPKWVWEPYGPFALDAAATAENTLAPKFITKEMDALALDWREIVVPEKRVWCNPPYSRAAGPIGRWIETFMYWQLNHDCHIVALLPADTSTKWFHFLWEYEQDQGEDEPQVYMTFLRKRVRHIDPATGKPGGSPKFGSLIVEFIP